MLQYIFVRRAKPSQACPGEHAKQISRGRNYCWACGRRFVSFFQHLSIQRKYHRQESE